MNSSQASCLLCLSKNKKTINFYSDAGKELNIISILSSHFWFTLGEIDTLPNICYECLNKIESFHEFYESVQIAHKKFETIFVKIENDLDIEDNGETCRSEPVPHDKIKIEDELVIEADGETYQLAQDSQDKIKILSVPDEDESSNSVCEIPITNSIDTETRAFNSLSKKTQTKYLHIYKQFLDWKRGENIVEDCFSEAVILEHFYYLQTKLKPNSLWAYYAMLKSTIQRQNNIDITYPEVTSFIKKCALGFRPQTNVFQPKELQRFFAESNDYEYLAVKVIMIFFIYCETRTDSLTNVGVNDVVEHGSVFVIRIPNTKNNDFRSFTLENEYAACVRKYKNLRPTEIDHDRFFVNYRNGKCTTIPSGERQFVKAPKLIASYLNLKDAESYTRFSVSRASTPNKRKIGGLNSEQMNLERSTEGTGTSMSTSSLDSSNVAMASTVSTNVNKSCEDDEVISLDLLPGTSKKYAKSYDDFMVWKSKEKIDKECFLMEVMLKYFNYLKPKYKPNSLWGFYSMLRSTIQKNHNVDIAYPELKSLLKATSFAYLPRRCELFRPDEIQRFLSEAADDKFLAVKVVVIFAIFGRLPADTFLKIDVNDVVEQGLVFVIRNPDAKANGLRSFTVENKYAAYVKKYKELRPENVSHNRFFINYRNGKCTVLPIGKTTLLKMSKIVAKFLNLNPKNYSLLSFRKKSRKRGRHLSSVLNSFNSKKINLETSTEAIATSSITSSVDTSSIAIKANNICKDVEETAWDVLNSKSRDTYLRAYGSFISWKEEENIDKECFSEEVMLQYFNYIKPKYKPTSLWAEYTKVRTLILKNHDVDISYPELKAFLRRTSSGYVPQKCSVFQSDEIRRFLSEADDNEFLFFKVVTIFVIFGGVHSEPLKNLEVNDVIEQGSKFLIKIPDAKINGFRSFTVENEYSAFVQKYKELRPENVTHTRFFIGYRKGQCTEQPIGQKKLLSTSRVVAKFLNLKDPESYLLVSFRNKSLKRGMDLSSVLENYTEECTPRKRKIGELGLLPEKTQEKYIRAYDNFMAWKTEENVDTDCFSKEILLKYFNFLKPKYRPSSLWSEFSMLTKTIQTKYNVDISYPEVKTFLRKTASGYLPQKSYVFQPDDIQRFLREASDNEFLASKIIMLFAIYGATSKDELTNIEVEDVIEQGSMISIKIANTTTNLIRSFTLKTEYAVYVEKYIRLRPQNVQHKRFFINYGDGKCTTQPIGKLRFARTPKIIAHFLNLEDADNYSFHGLRKHLKNS